MTTHSHRKKYFTPAEANAMLPLLRSILRDVTELAHNLRDRHERLTRLRAGEGPRHDDFEAELERLEQEADQDRERMQGYEEELENLGVEIKDYYTGLLDFPCVLEGRDVYLCWRLGEPEVAHWHELDAGFAGRQKLTANICNP